jgi:hypothetical protein
MRKTKQRLPLVAEQKAFVATEDRNKPLKLIEVMHSKSISGILSRDRKSSLALPGFDRQRLSDMGRGWCPPLRREKIESDDLRRKRGGPFRRVEAHRLS